MTNNTVKKQNKLLLAALVLILAAATALVAITGTANRKKGEEPPIDDKKELGETAKDSEETNDKAVSDKDKNDKTTDEKTDKTVTDTALTKIDEKADDKKGEEIKDEGKKPDENKQGEAEKTGAEGDAVQASAEADELPVFSAPVDGVVIKSASVSLPVFSYTMNDYRTHGGLDFACSPGTPVFAAADGEVAEVVDDPMMGVSISLTHAGGAVTRYKGLAEETIGMLSVGDTVAKGDVIGVSGDTALIESAEENHVHFELSVNGETKDPADYMSVVFLSDLTED